MKEGDLANTAHTVCTYSFSGATLRWPDHLVEKSGLCEALKHGNLLYNGRAGVPSTLNATGEPKTTQYI